VVKRHAGDITFDTFGVFLHCPGNPPKSVRSQAVHNE